MSDRLSRDEMRAAILARVDTFTDHVEWIGGSADLAFADSIVALMEYLATQPRERSNDGLTDAERHASAERWRNGAGRTPSKDEMNRLRAVTPVTHKVDAAARWDQ